MSNTPMQVVRQYLRGKGRKYLCSQLEAVTDPHLMQLVLQHGALTEKGIIECIQDLTPERGDGDEVMEEEQEVPRLGKMGTSVLPNMDYSDTEEAKVRQYLSGKCRTYLVQEWEKMVDPFLLGKVFLIGDAVKRILMEQMVLSYDTEELVDCGESESDLAKTLCDMTDMDRLSALCESGLDYQEVVVPEIEKGKYWNHTAASLQRHSEWPVLRKVVEKISPKTRFLDEVLAWRAQTQQGIPNKVNNALYCITGNAINVMPEYLYMVPSDQPLVLEAERIKQKFCFHSDEDGAILESPFEIIEGDFDDPRKGQVLSTPFFLGGSDCVIINEDGSHANSIVFANQREIHAEDSTLVISGLFLYGEFEMPCLTQAQLDFIRCSPEVPAVLTAWGSSGTYGPEDANFPCPDATWEIGHWQFHDLPAGMFPTCPYCKHRQLVSPDHANLCGHLGSGHLTHKDDFWLFTASPICPDRLMPGDVDYVVVPYTQQQKRSRKLYFIEEQSQIPFCAYSNFYHVMQLDDVSYIEPARNAGVFPLFFPVLSSLRNGSGYHAPWDTKLVLYSPGGTGLRGFDIRWSTNWKCWSVTVIGNNAPVHAYFPVEILICPMLLHDAGKLIIFYYLFDYFFKIVKIPMLNVH